MSDLQPPSAILEFLNRAKNGKKPPKNQNLALKVKFLRFSTKKGPFSPVTFQISVLDLPRTYMGDTCGLGEMHAHSNMEL
jgi:hypothetical protein